MTVYVKSECVVEAITFKKEWLTDQTTCPVRRYIDWIDVKNGTIILEGNLIFSAFTVCVIDRHGKPLRIEALDSFLLNHQPTMLELVRGVLLDKQRTE